MTEYHQRIFYPKKNLDACWQLIDEYTDLRYSVETVEVASSIGRVNVPRIFAPKALPAFATSTLDGFACRRIESKTKMHLEGSSLPGTLESGASLSQSSCFYVSTGARVPTDADCVIPTEECFISGNAVAKVSQTVPTEFSGIRLPGSDTRRSESIMDRLCVISAGDVGLLSACGVERVEVVRKVRVALLSTGNEVYSAEISDANRPFMKALLSQLPQIQVDDLGVVQDDKSLIETLLTSTDFDVLVSTGGVGFGQSDFMKAALEDSGYQILFGQMDLKPGKPTTVAVKEDRMVFALPGNPASCFVTFHMLVLPTLMKRAGLEIRVYLPSTRVKLELTESIVPDPQRPEYLRAVTQISAFGHLVAKLVSGHQRSSRAASCSGKVNSLILIPPGSNPIVPRHTAWFDCYLLLGASLHSSAILSPTGAPSESESNLTCISTESKARAFDSLVEWLKARNDVENIDLMNLAGFCRNCLSKWLSGSGSEKDINHAKKYVYGMDYEEWKKKYQKGQKKSHNPIVHSGNPCASSFNVSKTVSFKGFSLTISDRASRGEYMDQSGPLIEEFLKTLGANSLESAIVPDEFDLIQSTAKRWIDEQTHACVLVTSGGTGFSPRDVTPEAIFPLIDKNAPGIVNLLLQNFSKEDPLFALSRLVAGVSKKTFIVTLPGRPAAVRKGLDCLALVLPKLIQDLGS